MTAMRSLVLPEYWMFDAMVRVPLGAHDISVRAANLGNSQRFGSGYAVGGVPNYFILAPRSVFVDGARWQRASAGTPVLRSLVRRMWPVGGERSHRPAALPSGCHSD